MGLALAASGVANSGRAPMRPTRTQAFTYLGFGTVGVVHCMRPPHLPAAPWCSSMTGAAKRGTELSACPSRGKYAVQEKHSGMRPPGLVGLKKGVLAPTTAPSSSYAVSNRPSFNQSTSELAACQWAGRLALRRGRPGDEGERLVAAGGLQETQQLVMQHVVAVKRGEVVIIGGAGVAVRDPRVASTATKHSRQRTG